MAWLYHRSATWRRIVSFTAQSPWYMAGFTAAAVAIPYFMGDQIMSTTNGPSADGKLEQQLRGMGGVDAKILARAQRERLQVLLDEVKERRGGETRYQAALE